MGSGNSSLRNLFVELGSGKAFIGAGPYAGYGISAKSGGVNLFKKNNETGKASMNRFDYGVGGIIGYDFNKNWQINASYQFGLADPAQSRWRIYEKSRCSYRSSL